MLASSIRKCSFIGIAAALAVSGLTMPMVTAQAAQGSIQLLNSPALGSLSTLGGVSGYVNSQAGGNVNGWLSGQGIDPTAAGSITDTTLPSQAQGKINVQGNTVSLAADATLVDVGYIVGDAKGTANLNLSVSDLAVAPGHTNDSFAMTWDILHAWLNGTTWTGRFAGGLMMPTFDFTMAWGPNNVTVTPTPSTATTQQVSALIETQINALEAPGTMPLSTLVTADTVYPWEGSADIPYSFAYAMNGALTPGGSVSVDLSSLVADSWLKDFTVANAQASGPLTGINISSVVPNSVLQALTALPEFSSFVGATKASDLVRTIVTQTMLAGDFDQWAYEAMLQQVAGMGDSFAAAGITLNPLDDPTKAKILTNTHPVIEMMVQNGFPSLIANGLSGKILVNSTFNPGSLVSPLTPTGVSVAAPPPEVDPQASTLTLSASEIVINQQASCSGGPVVNPSSVTATATVKDTTGAPMSGVSVTFGVDSPLVLDHTTATTNASGVATAVITLPNENPLTTVAHVTAQVGTGINLTPAQLSVSTTEQVSPAPPTLTVEPTSGSTVLADGQQSYTASVYFTDECGRPESGIVAQFTVTGSAHLSAASQTSGGDGYAKVTLTDTTAETVAVTARSAGVQIGDPVSVAFDAVPATGPDASKSALSVSPTTATADCGDTVTVTAQASVKDVNNAPLSGVSVKFANGQNSVSIPTGADGVATTTFTYTVGESNIQDPISATIAIGGVDTNIGASPTSVNITVGESCTGPVEPPVEPTLTGTLELNPAQVTNGQTVATATVTDDQGVPQAGVTVTFAVSGDAQIAQAAPPTDGSGQTVVLVSTTSDGCDGLGFDVSATITVDGQQVQLSGSPAHATVVPAPGACGIPPVDPCLYDPTLPECGIPNPPVEPSCDEDPTLPECGEPVEPVEPVLTGTLVLNPALGNGQIAAIATVTDDQGVPQAGVTVTFAVAGNGQITQGTSSTTDADGHSAVVVVATADGCQGEGFDVSATIAVDGQQVQLSGSPAHWDIQPAPDACEAPPIVIEPSPCEVDPTLPECSPIIIVDPVATRATLVVSNATLNYTPGNPPTVTTPVKATVTVFDQDDAPMDGVQVSFAANPASVVFSGQTVTTNQNGVAEATITPTSGNHPANEAVQISATVGQVPVTPASVTVTLVQQASGGDTQPPAAPRIDVANATGVSGGQGAAEANATVQVSFPNGSQLPGTVQSDGAYTVATPANMPSGQVSVTATDAAGNVSAATTAYLDTVRPNPPRIDQADLTAVAGTVGAAESLATVSVRFPDETVSMTQAQSNGSYSVATPAGMPTGLVTVTVQDAAQNVSDPVTVNLEQVQVVVPPPPPPSSVSATAFYATVTAGATQTVRGTGFIPGERVTISLCTPSCSQVASVMRVNSTGTFSSSFPIPRSTPAGTQTVTLTGTQSGSVSVSFEVNASSTNPPRFPAGGYYPVPARWWGGCLIVTVVKLITPWWW